jgi:hypothetical protein
MGDGLEVTDVDAEGPAYAAGLRAGDRIRRVDDESNTLLMDERILTWRLGAPPPTTIEFERDKKRQTIVGEPGTGRRGGGPSSYKTFLTSCIPSARNITSTITSNTFVVQWLRGTEVVHGTRVFRYSSVAARKGMNRLPTIV